LRQEIEVIAERPGLQETLAEIANLPPATWGEPLAQTIRSYATAADPLGRFGGRGIIERDELPRG
jgi:hypothetical protein